MLFSHSLKQGARCQLGKVEKEFNQGENVILDNTDLKPGDASALRNAIEQKGWSDKIRWYNP